jgi:hypothetical protein
LTVSVDPLGIGRSDVEKNVQQPRYLDAAQRNLIRINAFPCGISTVFLVVFLIRNRSTGESGMQKNLKRQRQAHAGSTVAVNAIGRQSPPDGIIDIGPALECSRVTTLSGRPYPVQFRSQGGIDAWTRALGNTEVWHRWQAPGTLCWQIRQEILRQLERVPMPPVSGDMSRKVADDRQRLAVEISTNLKYHLNKGTVIEATPALETLLTNSDVDLNLPMSMVALPYRAQYLRFGEVAMRYLKVPASQAPDRFFDGVFCFLTPHDEVWTSPAPVDISDL